MLAPHGTPRSPVGDAHARRQEVAKSCLLGIGFTDPAPKWSTRGLSARFSAILAHRIGTHLDPTGVVYEPVEDVVGQRGIADLFVPP